MNDIKKYIDFRESIPQISHNIILLFLFGYHFSQEENNNKIIEELNLIKDIQFLPAIDYDEKKENIIIKLDNEEKESILFKVNNPIII